MITAADFVAGAFGGQADGQNQIVPAQTRRKIAQDEFRTRSDKYTYRLLVGENKSAKAK